MGAPAVSCTGPKMGSAPPGGKQSTGTIVYYEAVVQKQEQSMGLPLQELSLHSRQ